MSRERQVAFLAAAVADLERLRTDDPDLPRLALRRIRDLAARSVEGDPLHEMAATGDLSDLRKLYFGKGNPPSHRIVYRETASGRVEVIEVVAVEAREDLYAYLLAASRLGRLPEESRGRLNRVHQAVIERRRRRRDRNG